MGPQAGPDWLATKLLHHAGVPPVADACVQAQIEHKLPILRLVPADELYEWVLLLVPIAKGERDLPFDHATLNLNGVLRFWSTLKLMAQRAVDILSAEFECRGTIDDDRYSREFDQIKGRWMGRLRLLEQHLAEERAALEA